MSTETRRAPNDAELCALFHAIKNVEHITIPQDDGSYLSYLFSRHFKQHIHPVKVKQIETFSRFDPMRFSQQVSIGLRTYKGPW
jgi:hypothetical protein